VGSKRPTPRRLRRRIPRTGAPGGESEEARSVHPRAYIGRAQRDGGSGPDGPRSLGFSQPAVCISRLERVLACVRECAGETLRERRRGAKIEPAREGSSRVYLLSLPRRLGHPIRLGVDRHSQLESKGGRVEPVRAVGPGTLLNQCRLHKTKKRTTYIPKSARTSRPLGK
jgi:hypothetical protein